MKTGKVLIRTYFFMIFSFAIYSCCDSPIEKYEPRDRDEKAIMSILIQYQDAKNRFDLDQLLSLLHENGQFSFQCGPLVSKENLRELLPGYWAELKAGNSASIPIVHECINGDCYKSGKLNDLQIEISNDKAEATVLFTKGFTRVLQFFSMIRENDKWMITRTEWGHS